MPQQLRRIQDLDAPGARRLPPWVYWGAAILVPLTAAAAEFALGRRLWGVSGQPGLWSGEVLSPHNSQYLADPYTFTHITHGILLYALFRLVAGNRPLRDRALTALGFESAWEVIENTDFVIRRYRAQTLALNYFGDSVMNSMFDIVACMIGFLIASRLPARVTLVFVIALELSLALWIHDGLLLNILMLVHPVHAIELWQAGPG
jgi:hypothetical protein